MTTNEIEQKQKEVRSLNKEIPKLQNKLFDIDVEDWNTLVQLIEEKNQLLKSEIKSRHEKKLLKLEIQSKPTIEDKNVTKRGDKTDLIEHAEAVFNYSNRDLSDIEKRVLSKGLKYGIRNKTVDKYEILSRFEELAQTMDKLEISEEKDELIANMNTKNAFFQSLKNVF